VHEVHGDALQMKSAERREGGASRGRYGWRRVRRKGRGWSRKCMGRRQILVHICTKFGGEVDG
jgi:hypothetical protein